MFALSTKGYFLHLPTRYVASRGLTSWCRCCCAITTCKVAIIIAPHRWLKCWARHKGLKCWCPVRSFTSKPTAKRAILRTPTRMTSTYSCCWLRLAATWTAGSNQQSTRHSSQPDPTTLKIQSPKKPAPAFTPIHSAIVYLAKDPAPPWGPPGVHPTTGTTRSYRARLRRCSANKGGKGRRPPPRAARKSPAKGTVFDGFRMVFL